MKLRNFTKKFGFAVVLLLALVSVLPGFSTVQAAYKTPFDINSVCVYMINTDTDTVIYEQNADVKTYPASLTKIMTAILMIEQVPDLEGTMVTAPRYIYDEFVGMNVSTADIRAGETVSMLDLLYALLLPSSCEAGSIVADYLGEGSIDAFVEQMNRKAQELGAVNTNFVNAHGLFDENQVTTARDMYLIAKYALSLPMFSKVCNTTTYLMPTTSYHPNGNWYIQQTNKLLVKGHSDYYEYAAGVKTGTLDEVGRNLISTASRDGYNYMLVTLGAPIYDASGKSYPNNLAFEDARNLYGWAFDSFSLQTVLKENEVIGEVDVALSAGQDYVRLVAGEDVTALLPKDADPTVVDRKKTLLQNVKAPVKKGDVLGRMELILSDETIATVDMYAMENIDRSTWLYALDVSSRFLKQPVAAAMLIGLGVLLLFFFIALGRYRRRKRLRAMRERRYRRQ